MTRDAQLELAARSAMPEGAWAELESVPAWVSWPLLRRRFIEATQSGFERWIAADQKHFDEQLLFAIGRFDEGARLLSHMRAQIFHEQPATVLDIGAGNGGVAFAFSNDRRNTVVACDIVPNLQAAHTRLLLELPLRQTVGDAAALPFETGSVDLVLLMDVLEHLPSAARSAAEIMRVLRPGGVCLISTPARVSYAFRRDPHYGVPALVLLPNEAQRFVVNRVLRRRVTSATGGRADAYDVEHLFWHAGEIARLFPGPKTVDVLYEYSYRPPGKFSRYWLRHPSVAIEQLRYELRRFFFGHMLVYKGQPDPGTPAFDRLES